MPCLVAVARYERRWQKCSAPVRVRMAPEIFLPNFDHADFAFGRVVVERAAVRVVSEP